MNRSSFVVAANSAWRCSFPPSRSARPAPPRRPRSPASPASPSVPPAAPPTTPSNSATSRPRRRRKRNRCGTWASDEANRRVATLRPSGGSTSARFMAAPGWSVAANWLMFAKLGFAVNLYLRKRPPHATAVVFSPFVRPQRAAAQRRLRPCGRQFGGRGDSAERP